MKSRTSKIDCDLFGLCFHNLYVSVCQMSVFYSGWKKKKRHTVRAWPHLRLKLQFHWPAPGLFDCHTAILTMWLLFSKPAPLQFLTPTPKWMAIGCFCSVVVKPPSKLKMVWQAFKVTLASSLYIVAEREPRFIKWDFICVQSMFSRLSWCVVLYEWLHIMVFKMINEVVSWIDVILCLHSSLRPEKPPTPPPHPKGTKLKVHIFKCSGCIFLFALSSHSCCTAAQCASCCVLTEKRTSGFSQIKL